MQKSMRFSLNGKPIQLQVDKDRTLLWVLRGKFGLTGAKYGCGEGLCGACTVIIGNEAVRSCQTKMKEVAGKEIITIEGLAQNGTLHPLQKAFTEHDALQCGYCTSGMILNAYGLLLKNPRPTRSQIVSGMDDNLCRCGAHQRIMRAIESVARNTEGGSR
jgi:aerobic-type carbon monoxide dehydrogenase small subunit (CoxS/CutS family)